MFGLAKAEEEGKEVEGQVVFKPQLRDHQQLGQKLKRARALMDQPAGATHLRAQVGHCSPFDEIHSYSKNQEPRDIESKLSNQCKYLYYSIYPIMLTYSHTLRRCTLHEDLQGMLERALQSRLHLASQFETGKLEQGGEAQGIDLHVILEVLTEELAEALLFAVGGVVRVLQHEVAARLEEVVHLVEKCLDSRIAQCQVDPLHSPQADHGVVLRLGLQIEEVIVKEEQVARKLLQHCQSFRHNFQIFFGSDDVLALCLFYRLLEIPGQLSNGLLQFLVSADRRVFLTILHQPIHSSLAEGQQVSIDVEGDDALGEHADGYFNGHCAVARPHVEHGLVEEEFLVEGGEARVAEGGEVVLGPEVAQQLHSPVLLGSDVEMESLQLSHFPALPTLGSQTGELLF